MMWGPMRFFLVYILLRSPSTRMRSAMIVCLKRRQGLTMVELAITLAIIGVLVATMMPSLGRWLSHNRIKSAARDIASCFRMAQMLAVQRNQASTVEINSAAGTVRVLDGGGTAARIVTFSDYKAQFDATRGGGNGIDFIDQPADGIISVTFNTRGIPNEEDGNPIGTPGVQNGERVFVENNRGEGYWVEVTPVGNIRYERYKN